MTRRSGGFRGAKPTWTTTSTSGIFGMEDVVDLKAAGQWPRGPVAPTSLAGTGSDQQVALTWVAPATTHGTITDYLVEYTPTAGSPTVVATGSTAASYTLTGLTNGTEYTIRVAAVNHTRGDWSSSVSKTPTAVVPDPDFASVSLLLSADGADGSTTFNDSSGSPKSVTAYGGASISTTQSKFGGASGRFAGTGQYLSVAHSQTFGTGDWTVETWLYSAWSTNDNMIMEFRNAATIAVWINSGGQVGVYTPQTSVGTRATIASNQWVHLALVRDAGTLRLYLDGVQQWSAAETSSFTTGTLEIGQNRNLNSNPQFYFDDYRISSVARYPGGTTFTPPTAAFPNQ